MTAAELRQVADALSGLSDRIDHLERRVRALDDVRPTAAERQPVPTAA